jgi:hypothetical protein
MISNLFGSVVLVVCGVVLVWSTLVYSFRCWSSGCSLVVLMFQFCVGVSFGLVYYFESFWFSLSFCFFVVLV